MSEPRTYRQNLPPAARRPVRFDLSKDLVAQIDERAGLGNMSRVLWVERALRWALEQPRTDRVETVTL